MKEPRLIRETFENGNRVLQLMPVFVPRRMKGRPVPCQGE